MIFILLYFILGILFAKVALPILNSLVSLMLTYLQIPEAKASLAISEYNVKISKLAEDKEDFQSFSIGFKAPTEEEINDEEGF